jgi:hypothetical protein
MPKQHPKCSLLTWEDSAISCVRPLQSKSGFKALQKIKFNEWWASTHGITCKRLRPCLFWHVLWRLRVRIEWQRYGPMWWNRFVHAYSDTCCGDWEIRVRIEWQRYGPMWYRRQKISLPRDQKWLRILRTLSASLAHVILQTDSTNAQHPLCASFCNRATTFVLRSDKESENCGRE